MRRTTRVTMTALAVVVAGTLGGARGTAGAQAINWTDWTSQGPIVANQATVQGTIDVAGTPVAVTYTGEVDFTQTAGGTNYWNPRATFLGAMLTDASPISSDIIALSGRGITSTFTFSSPILNPYISIVSAGRGGWPVDYVFTGATPVIVAGGSSASFGGGPLVPTPGNPNGVRGLEGNGTLVLNGTFSSITFTVLATPPEFWSGITLGVQGLGTTPTTVPEPSTVALMATGLAGLLGVARARRRRQG